MRRTTLKILAVAMSTVACGPETTVPGPEGKPGPTTQQLDALNQELVNVPYGEAMQQLPHFAPLCDAQGYPLVGNIVSKGGTTASEICDAVRAGRK